MELVFVPHAEFQPFSRAILRRFTALLVTVREPIVNNRPTSGFVLRDTPLATIRVQYLNTPLFGELDESSVGRLIGATEFARNEERLLPSVCAQLL